MDFRNWGFWLSTITSVLAYYTWEIIHLGKGWKKHRIAHVALQGMVQVVRVSNLTEVHIARWLLTCHVYAHYVGKNYVQTCTYLGTNAMLVVRVEHDHGIGQAKVSYYQVFTRDAQLHARSGTASLRNRRICSHHETTARGACNQSRHLRMRNVSYVFLQVHCSCKYLCAWGDRLLHHYGV